MRRSRSRSDGSISLIASSLLLFSSAAPPSRFDPLAFERIARLLPIRETTCVVQHVHVAVPLQQLAEGFTRYARLVGTVHDNLVFFVERLQRFLHGSEMPGTGNVLRLVGPLRQRHHQAKIVLAIYLLPQLLSVDCFHKKCALPSTVPQSDAFLA